MKNDKSVPAECNQEVFKKGKGVCVVHGRSSNVETWVKAVAKEANAQVDWHGSAGLANVLHLGDDASRQRVLAAIVKLEGKLRGSIFSVDGPALHRAGDPVREGTVAIDPCLA